MQFHFVFYIVYIDQENKRLYLKLFLLFDYTLCQDPMDETSMGAWLHPSLTKGKKKREDFKI